MTIVKGQSHNLLLYLATIMIWGTSWLAIKFQLGSVDPMASVAYRFLLASAISWIFCFFSGRLMVFSTVDHFFMFLQGGSLFSINYWLFYLSEINLVSGMAAIIFSTIVVMNILNGKIFLKNRLEIRVIIGAFLGLLGIIFVFWSEVSDFETDSNNILAAFLALIATYLASLGNIVSARNHRKGIPLLQANTYGMSYGAIIMLFLSWISGRELSIEFSVEYVSSLVFLSIFASIISFWTYLTLLGRVGVERAAYVFLLAPLVALVISTFAEDYQWSIIAGLGIFLVLVGNFIILKREN